MAEERQETESVSGTATPVIAPAQQPRQEQAVPVWEEDGAFQAELDAILSQSRSRVSSSRVSAITKIALRSSKFFKFVVHRLEKAMARAKPEQRLGLVYCIDSIVRNSQAKVGAEKDPFAARFAVNMAVTATLVSEAPSEDVEAARRMLAIWSKNRVFSEETIVTFTSVLDKAPPRVLTSVVKSSGDIREEDMEPSSPPPPPPPGYLGVESHGSTPPIEVLPPPPPQMAAPVVSVPPPIMVWSQQPPPQQPLPPQQPMQLPSYQSSPPVGWAPVSQPPQQPMPAQQFVVDPRYAQQQPPMQPPPFPVYGGGNVGGSSIPAAPAPAPVPAPILAAKPEAKEENKEAAHDSSVLQFDYGEDDEDEARIRALEERVMQQYAGINSDPATSGNAPAPVPAAIPPPVGEMYNPDLLDEGYQQQPMMQQQPHGQQYSCPPSQQQQQSPMQSHQQMQRGFGSPRPPFQRGPRGPAPPPGYVKVPSTTLFIGSVNSPEIAEQLMPTFSQFGAITSIKTVMDKGFAFISFSTRQEAEYARNTMMHQPLNGVVLKIGWARGNLPGDYFNKFTGEAFVPGDGAGEFGQGVGGQPDYPPQAGRGIPLDYPPQGGRGVDYSGPPPPMQGGRGIVSQQPHWMSAGGQQQQFQQQQAQMQQLQQIQQQPWGYLDGEDRKRGLSDEHGMPEFAPPGTRRQAYDPSGL